LALPYFSFSLLLLPHKLLPSCTCGATFAPSAFLELARMVAKLVFGCLCFRQFLLQAQTEIRFWSRIVCSRALSVRASVAGALSLHEPHGPHTVACLQSAQTLLHTFACLSVRLCVQISARL